MIYDEEHRTHFRPPSPIDKFHRSSLDRYLSNLERSQLSLVAAPAGFGKTCALAQWYFSLKESKFRCAWLTVSDSDNDPINFTKNLFEALSLEMPETKSAVSGVLDLTGSDQLFSYFRQRVSLALESVIYLFLDDLEVLQEPVAIDFLLKVVENSDNKIHFIMAGRTLEHLPFINLGLVRRTLCLGTAELKLNVPEAVELFASDNRQSWSKEFVEQLVSHTDGWMMALLAAKYQAEANRDPDQDARVSLASSADLQDYLVSEVLDHLDADMREFLLKISIVSEVNGDLANILCERGDGWGQLERIHQKNLFLSAADERQQWYKLHSLFREALLLCLRREFDAKFIQKLHERAAIWFWEKKRFHKAFFHAAESGNLGVAADWLESLGGWRLILRDGASILRSVQARFPEDFFEKSPSLIMSLMYIELKSGNVAKARKLFSDMENNSKGFSRWPAKPDHRDFADEALIMDIYIASYENTFVSAKKLQKLRDLQPSVACEDRSLGAFVDTLLCFHLTHAADFRSALDIGERALRHFLAEKSSYSVAFLRLLNSRALFAVGRMSEAENELKICADSTKNMVGPEARLLSNSAIFRAQIAYERNELDDASAFLQLAEPISLDTDNWYDSFETYFSTKASIAVLRSDSSTVNEVMAAAEEIAIYRNIPDLSERMKLRRLRIALIYNDLVKAEHLFDNLVNNGQKEKTDRLLGRYIDAVRLVGLSRYRIVNDDIDLAIESLRKAIAEASKFKWFMIETKLRVLLSAALWKGGKESDSVNELDEVVTLTLFENFKRTFVDESIILKPVLVEAVSRVSGYRTNRLKDARLNELKNLARGEVTRIKKSKESQKGFLTAKESEVVPLLAQGYSNKEIAQRLDVTENAIKYHLKNIFAKLTVHSRQDAILALRNSRLI